MSSPGRTIASCIVAVLAHGASSPAWARGHARAARIAPPEPASMSTRPPLDSAPPVRADSAIVVDLHSGETIFERNPDAVRPIASLTKLMVALVVLDRDLDLDGVTRITAEDRDTSRGGAPSRLLLGRSFRNRDLLTAMLMQSDNRAVTALGRAVGLAPGELVAALNARAVSMGLTATAFTDPVGLSAGNVSTPRELADVLAAALHQPIIRDITTRPNAQFLAADGSGYSVDLINTDHVAWRRGAPWTLLGGKTGYTDEAHYCLAIAASVGRLDVAMVFLGEEGKLTRFADFERAAEWLASREGISTTAR